MLTNLPDHFDLICLITHSPLPFGHFAWWLIRTQNKLPDQLGLGLRPICLITSTLFVWSLIPRYVSADLCDNLFEHKTMFTTAIFACSTVHDPTTHPHISMSFNQFAWSRRPYLPDHLFLVTFWLICVITYSNTKQTINFDQFAWSRRPYLPDHLFLVTFRLICEMTCANTKLYLLQSYNSICSQSTITLILITSIVIWKI